MVILPPNFIVEAPEIRFSSFKSHFGSSMVDFALGYSISIKKIIE